MDWATDNIQDAKLIPPKYGHVVALWVIVVDPFMSRRQHPSASLYDDSSKIKNLTENG